MSAEVVAKPHRVEYQSSVPSGTKSSTPGVGPLVSQYRIFNLFVYFLLSVLSLRKLFHISLSPLSFLAKYCRSLWN